MLALPIIDTLNAAYDVEAGRGDLHPGVVCARACRADDGDKPCGHNELGNRADYYFAPDVQQEWMWLTPGSFFDTTFWLAASLGFKYYVANWGNYTETGRWSEATNPDNGHATLDPFPARARRKTAKGERRGDCAVRSSCSRASTALPPWFS